MLRHERRLLVDSLFIGAALTLLVIAVDGGGFLAPAEDFLYDLRARTCQFFTPPPTDKLVHLDIDDTALDVLGAWPWPRRKMAQIFDEIRLAGPKAVEMDVLYSEPQLIQYEPIASPQPTSQSTSQPASQPTQYETIDNDAELAAAMKRLGNVIVPSVLEPIQRQSAQFAAMIEELRKDLEQDEGALLERLRARGDVKVPEKGVGDQFFLARREAIMQRLAAMKVTPQTPWLTVRKALIPRTPENVHPGIENVVREQWEKFLAIREFRERLSLVSPPGLSARTNMRVAIAPLRQYSEAAAGGAFVDYSKFGSAVIRTLPLLLEQDRRVYPQMGLALAAKMLDADLNGMRVQGDTLILPRRAGADVVIPLAPPRMATTGYMYANLMDIPWFGGRQWETMYDHPAHRTSKQHVPMHDVWQACFARDKLTKNNRELDDAIRGVYAAMDADSGVKRIAAYNAALPPVDDYAARQKIVRDLLENEYAGYLEDWEKTPLAERAKLDHRQQVFMASLMTIKTALDKNNELVAELNGFRAKLSSAIKGKAVLVGWTATAAIADFVPTSLHEKCPGVVVHGVIFNGIMTGQMWRRLPWGVAVTFAIAMGLITALAVGWISSALRGMIIAGALIVAYLLINGVVLFDYGNRIVGLAGPLTTVVVVWGGCTVIRGGVEARHREHIKRRFSNYADQRLVDYVLENENVTFEGESREMTVVFTDLAGFTTLSERLGEKIVPVLNELLGELVPVISDHHQGYINKFLGDGIMFFYNAPRLNPQHATNAVGSVLDMQAKLAEYNLRLRERGLPELSMRAGVASGNMIVGDAGGGGRSDYTVLGDAVNLSSRLEAANKQTGTHTLINARAAELLDGKFLVRPIGRIQVVGQEQAGMCYEPMARADAATDKQREVAAITTKMVESFAAGSFGHCVAHAAELDAACGGSSAKLTALYREMCERYLREGKPENFDGRIVLTSK